MHAPTPPQAAEIGRLLQEEMTDTPESFEICGNEEREKAALESVAAAVQNLENLSLQKRFSRKDAQTGLGVGG